MSGLGKLLVLGVVTLVSPGLLDAQAPISAAPGQPVGYGGFQAGVLGLDLGELNQSLAAAGLPRLDESAALWGGGGYGVIGKLHLGGVGHGGLDPAAVSGSRRVALKGGYGLLRARYQIISIGGLHLLPALGVGAGGMSLQIADLDTPDFDDVLADPTRSSTLSTGMFIVLNAGLGMDLRVALREGEDGGAWGVVLGVEGGYLGSPGDTSWRHDGVNDVIGGPTLGVEGFYLWFSLGGWAR